MQNILRETYLYALLLKVPVVALVITATTVMVAAEIAANHALSGLRCYRLEGIDRALMDLSLF